MVSSDKRGLAFKVGLFIGVMLLALAFAGYTNHVWEDYYITYRSSKNLASGHGLVFNHGDRLHTFTSPLGVLLPAAAFALTGNSSDTGALWIFRIMSAAALGGAATLLAGLAARLGLKRMAAMFAVAMVVTDAKTLDFTINGMETAFMLLFLAYAWWAHLRPGPRQWAHLGGAWAGLMWTRPDSFIYVGLVAVGLWLFNDPERTGHDRRGLIRLYLKAGLLTTALYLPWLAWAAGYYGSPVPHTIAAKGSISAGKHTLGALLLTIIKLPWLAWREFATLEMTWLPSYYLIGGWPAWLVWASRAVATFCALVWLIPGVRREARVASLAFFGAHVYLTFFPYFPFPWYVPPTALLGAVVLGLLLDQVLVRPREWAHKPALGLMAIAVAAGCWMTWQVARQAEAQQRLVENGTRRAIGEWLRHSSQPGDTVFMEPLGYIGYFSGLKTYDYPGMSSREMVEARRKVGEAWSKIIGHLQPSWLVLRPFEIDRINREHATLLEQNYTPAWEFNQLDAVRRESVRGRPYLEHDARFIVYRLKQKLHFDTASYEISSPFPSTEKTIEGVVMREVHAPGSVRMPIPRGAQRIKGRFGFTPGAGEGPHASDGATFIIECRAGDSVAVLLEKKLEPGRDPAHRLLQSYDLALPARLPADAVLILRTEPGTHSMQDWTCWNPPEFW